MVKSKRLGKRFVATNPPNRFPRARRGGWTELIGRVHASAEAKFRWRNLHIFTIFEMDVARCHGPPVGHDFVVGRRFLGALFCSVEFGKFS